MYIVVLFYSYLLKQTEWLILVISGIEFTTCFKNMPMQFIICYSLNTSAKLTLFYQIAASFAKKYKYNMFFLIWVKLLKIA